MLLFFSFFISLKTWLGSDARAMFCLDSSKWSEWLPEDCWRKKQKQKSVTTAFTQILTEPSALVWQVSAIN